MPDNMQRAHQLFRHVKQTNQLPWWEWHLPSNTVTSSPLKPAMLGYDPADFANAGYQAYTDLVHPDDFERTMQAMRDHLAGRAALYQIDYRIRKASGDYTWYCDRGAILERADDGSPVMVRGVVLDLGQDLSDRSHDQTVVDAIRDVFSRAGGDAPVVICSQCARLRYGDDQWAPVGEDLEKGFPFEISHGLCNDCLRTLYPDQAEAIIERL